MKTNSKPLNCPILNKTCVEPECAWYDHEGECCYIVSLGIILTDIVFDDRHDALAISITEKKNNTSNGD